MKEQRNLRNVWVIYVLVALIILGAFITYWRYPRTLTIGFLERLPFDISLLGTREAVIDGFENLKNENDNVHYKLVIKDYTNYVELREAYEELASDKKVKAIIGPPYSSDAKEIVDIVEKYGKLTILQGITNPDVLKSSPYFISTGISDDFQIEAIKSYVKNMGYKKVVIVKSSSNPVYTDYVASNLEKDLKISGINVQMFTYYSEKKTQNFYSEITPDTELVVLIAPINESAITVSNLDINGEFLLTDWSASREIVSILGLKSEGIKLVSFCPYDLLKKSPYDNYAYLAAFEIVGMLKELFSNGSITNPVETFTDYEYKGKYIDLRFKNGLLLNDVYIWKVENLKIKDYMKFSVETGGLQKVED